LREKAPIGEIFWPELKKEELEKRYHEQNDEVLAWRRRFKKRCGRKPEWSDMEKAEIRYRTVGILR